MADRLHLSRSTVKTHIASIYDKLGVPGRSEAVEILEQLGLGSTEAKSRSQIQISTEVTNPCVIAGLTVPRYRPFWPMPHRSPSRSVTRQRPIRIRSFPTGIATWEANLMVTIASSYPFLNILWTILIFMALVIWIWMVIMVLIDVFSRPDLSGWAKAGWVVLIIVLPFVGVLIYLIAYSAGIAERRA
jgi:hypothetical protein